MLMNAKMVDSSIPLRFENGKKSVDIEPENVFNISIELLGEYK
jgi:hypothetical protein